MRVLYTSVFGDYDDVVEPKLPSGWDWKYFSEKNSLPLYSDNNRNAKRFKILPHRYLKEYEYSIFMDGNMYVVGNVDELVDKYLNDCNIAFFNHLHNQLDPRDCIYDEYNAIINLGNNDPNKKYKDNPDIMNEQINRYYKDGYPSHNGLITGMVILRRHNEKDCIQVMEDWWTEIKYGSKRDQLSFNYVAWKNKTKFNYMDGDSRNNQYFTRDTNPHKGSK
jgi:hypothetical protein|tara:strand:- start:3850 stop:4512 length:663 start_codon:yes stop_codon:yes gene_type:complete